MVTIKIPCKSYVKKYLIARYGKKHTITRNSFLGLFVSELLTKEFDPKQKYKSYEAEYEIEISEWMFKNIGHTISVKSMEAIGSSFYLIFREDLFEYVQLQLKKGVNASNAIKEFLNNYDIKEDELKFESIYRDYKRKNFSLDKHFYHNF